MGDKDLLKNRRDDGRKQVGINRAEGAGMRAASGNDEIASSNSNASPAPR